MRLSVTGAVVRAAQSARLTAFRPAATLAAPIVGGRWQSTEAAPRPQEAYPDQSVPAEREVDPLRTAQQATRPRESQREQRFKELLREDNKVVNDGDLSGARISGHPYMFDTTTNLSPSILNTVDRNIYNVPSHPICITRRLIESVFQAPKYRNHIAVNPVVTTHENFDVLGFPQDHPGRSRTDTYYVNSDHVLRTHTSAHQHAAFEYMSKNPESGYTICADVYRRDSIDRSHFPVFHQMEGARTWQLKYTHPKMTRYTAMVNRRKQMQHELDRFPRHNLNVADVATFDYDTNPPQTEHDEQEVRLMVRHLHASLEQLIARVFTAAREGGVGNASQSDEPMKVRWIEAYFPFTSPSFEVEVYWQGEWLELLGCGIVKQSILNNAGLRDRVGWAWGIGIERLAMLLFGIPDIRLFWSQDKRFLDQFQAGRVKKFEPFSKYPACYKDIAFWINASPAGASPVGAESGSSVAAAAGGDATKASPSETQPAAFHENDVMEIVRDIGGSLVEDVKLVDEFVHPTSGRKSLCYRINYRSLERTLTNEEINRLHERVAASLKDDLGVELR